MKETNFIIKRLKSKTYWLGIAAMAMSYMQTNADMLRPFLEEHFGLVMFLFGLGSMFIRELTKAPVSDK